jgi:hypothetical protein
LTASLTLYAQWTAVATGGTIGLVGTPFYSSFGTNNKTLNVSNVAIGNYRLLSVKISSTSFTVAGVSGGGVTTWTELSQQTTTAEPGDYEIWGGVVTATGAQTITVAFSGTTGVNDEFFSSELAWSGGIPSSWSLEDSGVNAQAGGGPMTFPSLTTDASGDAQAYWGSSRGGGAAWTGGSTGGFTYSAGDGNGNGSLFCGTLTGDTTYAPTATPTPTTSAWAMWAVIVEAVP